MKYSKLSEHINEKGVFVSPFVHTLRKYLKDNSWIYSRLPEYIWIGLLLNNNQDRTTRILNVLKIFNVLSQFPEFNDRKMGFPRITKIATLSINSKLQFFDEVKKLNLIDSLSPILLMDIAEINEFNVYFKHCDISFEEKKNKLIDTIEKMRDHQSDFSTDVRYAVIYLLSKNTVIHADKKSIFNKLYMYPYLDHKDERMKIIRPTIRSFEISFVNEMNEKYITEFWNMISAYTECKEMMIQITNNYKESVDLVNEKVYKVLDFYKELYKNCCPHDEKLFTMISMLTYNYKIFLEVKDNNIENGIIARSALRTITEVYMINKYLIKSENKDKDVWKKYQIYGLGKFKLIYERKREFQFKEKEQSHIDFSYVDMLVSENINKEFIDMDITFFDKSNIRSKFDLIDELDLWKYEYEYDTQYVHGFWGAIRESSVNICDNPSHLYHGLPDIDNNQKLRSVIPDMVEILIKHIYLIDSQYNLPSNLRDEI